MLGLQLQLAVGRSKSTLPTVKKWLRWASIRARAILKDAEKLLQARRFDGAFYLCGYSVELALKARMCRTLGWPEFPQTSKQFRGLQSIKTHDLEILLKFSGRESIVKTSQMAAWSLLLDWNPTKRYQPVGHTSKEQAAEMLTSARRLLKVI